MLSIIVAFDKNQLIGNDNKMPWHYKEDLKYFKEVTLNKTVVMGSNTYKSILSYLNHPLPNRHNIVLTRNPDQYKDIESYQSINEFLNVYQNKDEEIFIIGGANIYQQFIKYVDRLYITHIEQEFKGDTYFPQFNYQDFNLIREKKLGDLRFCVYERKVTLNE